MSLGNTLGGHTRGQMSDMMMVMMEGGNIQIAKNVRKQNKTKKTNNNLHNNLSKLRLISKTMDKE